MEIVVNHIGGIASLIGSLTVVGSALIWVYNKFIGAPREKRREKDEAYRQEQMLKMIVQENVPLNKSIQSLNKLLEQSKIDRDNLNKIAKTNTTKIGENTRKIYELDDRLIVVETKNGIYRKGGE